MNPVVQRRLDVRWLKEGALARVLALLDSGGEEARVVGGAVRNALLGEPIGDMPGDFDVATTAPPDEVIHRAEAAGLKAVPTGIEHGTVTVVVDGGPIEVTTLREDVETFGRKATVRFGRDWQADAQRRDFTINALSLGRDGLVHDTVGGLADLAARRVRFIGDPAQRIAEDHLRILRFFRFHAAYGHGAPDAAGLHACIVARGKLERLSRERVRAELMKLLLARHAAATLTVMVETGILIDVLGGVAYLPSFADMVAVEAVLGLPADPVRRLAALAVMVEEDAERLAKRLRSPNAERDRMASMGQGWWRIGGGPIGQGARALLYRLGPERYLDRVLLAWARSSAEASDAAWRELAQFPETWVAPALPLKAADLIRRGVPQGPALGAAMRAAEDAWIAADFPGDAASLERIAASAAKP